MTMANLLLGFLLTLLGAASAASFTSGSIVTSSSAALLLTSSLFTPSSAANTALEELDRPQAASKVNIWADDSSDDEDSSDDDEDDGTPDNCLVRNPNGTCRTWNNVQHFYNDFGELELKWSSCNDPYDDGDHEDFEVVATEHSLYQKIMFEENLKAGDKCLRLDSTLQQCSTYRPHYHEPFVHLSAAYLNKGYLSGVRRVVFVGGGDSMLLHEILKYDNLEMVLGLELDQKVTRNSFEHFKTQPHFDNPKVQWWFGDGAKSLTLLPREYFGTFDLVLLDLSETVMSMTVTKGLDVFGAMKLLLSPTGILVKNDFGYFEKLSKVFDTCLQLLMPDVTYICDYELVLCSSDEVNLLNPSFYHLKGVKEGNVETLVYKPQENIDDHWGPVTDYSKYWGEPRKCVEPGADTNDKDAESVAYAGVLMIVEAENVSMNVKDAKTVADALKKPLTELGYEIISTTTRSSANGGASLAIAMEEGYILLESWPDAKYCKLDIHLWGAFEKQDQIRSEILKLLGTTAGNWQSYRIVTGGMRGTNTRANDLKTVGPDLKSIGQCEEVKKGSAKAIVHNSSYKDEATLGPIIEAGLNEITTMMIDTVNINAVVFCGDKGSECRAKSIIEKKGYTNLITLWSCASAEEKEMDSSPYHRGLALQKWREAMLTDDTEFSLCGKKADVALKEISAKMQGVNLVVVDALAPSQHVMGSHQYWLKYWKTIKKPFLLLVPILDANDRTRTFFLKSRYNHGDVEPEFYSEIYVGDGKKTMSFGMIHEGNSETLQKLMRAQVKLDQNAAVKFSEIRKVTIRGAMREQTNYNPVIFSWADYNQRPGLEQFYSQRPVGLQTVLQLGLAPKSSTELSFPSIKKAFKSAMQKFDKGSTDSFHEIGDGGLYIGLSSKGQVAITWDGAGSVIVNIFTYDENADLNELFAVPFNEGLPAMSLMLRDEQPRGYGRVINKSDRVNPEESPDCYDHYKLCPSLAKKGNCEGGEQKEWMTKNCMFSCKKCDKDNSYAKSEL
ncbi:hypothetical protein ACHAWU_010038 [Discostella pseudostelligera]|uniref:ShKT domain-containing protein n=1 Tax=Discostella pseudostelligera TaxID=259834 RepID=A0ABD3NAX2_9STRA